MNKITGRCSPSAAVTGSAVLPDGKSLLDLYPRGTALIRYHRPDGSIRDWFIGAVPGIDNEATLRKHLGRFSKNCKFIGWAIK